MEIFFEGEGGTHARNDGLLSTIFHFASLTSVCRDNHQFNYTPKAVGRNIIEERNSFNKRGREDRQHS